MSTWDALIKILPNLFEQLVLSLLLTFDCSFWYIGADNQGPDWPQFHLKVMV